jgi:hypothetical protein
MFGCGFTILSTSPARASNPSRFSSRYSWRSWTPRTPPMTWPRQRSAWSVGTPARLMRDRTAQIMDRPTTHPAGFVNRCLVAAAATDSPLAIGGIAGISASGGMPTFPGELTGTGNIVLHARSVAYIENNGNTEVLVNTPNKVEIVTNKDVSGSKHGDCPRGHPLADFHHVLFLARQRAAPPRPDTLTRVTTIILCTFAAWQRYVRSRGH